MRNKLLFANVGETPINRYLQLKPFLWYYAQTHFHQGTHRSSIDHNSLLKPTLG